MQLITINQNSMMQNVYLYFDDEKREGIIIDLGHNAHEMMDAVNAHDVTIVGIFLTHAHYDHITETLDIKQHTQAPVYCYVDEQSLIEDEKFNLSYHSGQVVAFTPDCILHDGDVVSVGAAALKVIHTPGHTQGGMCLYDEANAVLFTGDTLFFESIGRADLPTGNEATLIQSIKDKLMVLPDDVKVYPGHGKSTTILHEKQYNPYIEH